jgi:lipopolysaccharide export system permease protein
MLPRLAGAMSTLHLYVTRQILAGLVMTVVVFTFFLLLGNILKEVLALLMSGQVTLGLVARALGLLIPFVLVFALPMGLLTATLLVFGRLSADQELTAARAAGISLVALSTPVFLLAVAASCLSAWINLDLAPRCRTAYKELLYRVAVERAASFIEADRFITDFDGLVVYIAKKDGDELFDIQIYEFGEEGRPKRRVRAERAVILTDTVNVSAVLRLYRVHFFDFEKNLPAYTAEWDGFRLDYRAQQRKTSRTQISDMNILQLWATLRDMESLDLRPSPPPGASAEELREYRRQVKEVRADLTMPVRVQIHRQIAFSFACIGFTLVGVPLGVRAHRRETSAGVALALVLVVIYYAFVILAQSLEDQPRYGPHLILWIPNFIFQVAGGYLLWRANRGL